MPCYKPLQAVQSFKKKKNGKASISFSDSTDGVPIQLPCGQCIGCRLERSRQWATRCYHEASLHTENAFITLTYDEKHLPENRSIDVREFQLFMKRLRKKYKEKKIKFFHCGEYGETTMRPHYHACLFGHDFKDKILFNRKKGVNIYTSEELSKLWKKGFVTTGEVTFQSAAYVARYIMKKVTGNQADEHYKILDVSTGELIDRKPEYTTMSRRPGIAKKWFEEFSSDVYPGDFVVINGKKVRPPRYYDGLYEITNREEYEIIKTKRIRDGYNKQHDNTKERLIVKEKICQSKIKQLKRNLE